MPVGADRQVHVAIGHAVNQVMMASYQLARSSAVSAVADPEGALAVLISPP